MAGWEPDHLGLPLLKAVAPRVAFFVHAPEITYESGQFTDRLIEISNWALSNGNQDSLCNWLRKHLLTQMKSAVGDAQRQLTILAKGIEPIRCDECVQGSPRERCQGEDRRADAQNVHARGLCLTPLKEQFQAAVDAARELYRSRLKTEFRDFHIEFETKDTGSNSAHDFPVPYRVGGTTKLLEDGSAIRLRIEAREFDRESFFAITYVLFHEAICHAFQGSISDSGREACGDYDEFAEGWMDWIAWQTLDRLLETATPGVGWIRRRDRVRQIAENFHQQRRNLECRKPGPSRFAEFHLVGYRIGVQMYEFLTTLNGRDSWDDFVALSLAINQLPLTSDERDAFVDQVGAELARVFALERAVEASKSPLAKSVVEFLRARKTGLPAVGQAAKVVQDAIVRREEQ